ncbi:MAG: acyltransferase family protein [Actinomycetota bacterium]
MPRPAGAGRPDISRVPYLPGLDGMRALAVVAVMVYHANSSWLKGGFLGVEVFFVISGYLITLLLVAEKERSDTVDMKQFWIRRARRLLPALFLMITLLTIWTALFERDALGKLRGDVVAAFFYVSNWYQIFTGAGYTAPNDFAPLRHLWSLAVEEQFYLVWPLVMVLVLRAGSRGVTSMARWFLLAAVVITVLMAVLYQPGPIRSPELTPDQYWTVFGREISKVDTLYLSTITRAGGLLLGAAFALVWRPVAVMRGPLRTKGRLLDGFALVGFVGIAAMCVYVGLVDIDGADPFLFRGGFFIASLLTLMMIAGVTHQHAFTSRVLRIPVLLWIGTRSYGLYLYHWPIYQLIRNIAGKPLEFHEFALAMVATAIITELSYRYVETPIRKGALGRMWTSLRDPRHPSRRGAVVTGAAVGTALAVFAGASLATAELKQNEVAESIEEGRAATCDVVNDPTCGAVDEPEPTGDVGATADSAGDPTSETVVVDSGGDETEGDGADPATVTEETIAGGVVVPETTAAPSPSTTAAPPANISRLAVGDSVMLGAAPALQELGFTVDATESRAFINGLDTVLTLEQQGRLGDTVVIHLGTNGPISQSEMDRMMAALSGVPNVILVLNSLPASFDYTDDNNALIINAAASSPNTTALYWNDLVNTCPGDCLYEDEIHLRPDGQEYYAALIANALGL